MNGEAVQEIRHEVRMTLPDDTPPMTTELGLLERPDGLHVTYHVRRLVAYVDIAVEFEGHLEAFPHDAPRPEWMSRLIDAHRPADVDDPRPNRRPVRGCRPLAPATVAADVVTGHHDPDALHEAVIRGLRAAGFGREDAERYASAHQQDVLDRAGDAIGSEAWPHERPKCENEELYRLADKVRSLLATEAALRLPGDGEDICWCGQVKQSGENHAGCFPGMD